MILLGYARLSKEDQDEHGLTLEVQVSRLIRAGVPTENIYSDYQSGDDSSRPSYMALLARAYLLVGSGEEVEIISTRLDRLSRDDHELERVISKFDDLGIKYKALEGGYYSTLEVHDWQRVKLEGFIAQTYIRQLSANVRRRKAEQRSQGIPIYGKTPFGYRFNGNKTKLIVHEEEGQLIRKWVADFIDGSSVRN
jgi:DNA invertase Pin-like site-specific DNA recombinase